MKISPEQLKLYAVTDRSWLNPMKHLHPLPRNSFAQVSAVSSFVKKIASDEESFRKPPF